MGSNIKGDIADGDWTLFITLDKSLAKGTAADVKRVANTYLKENQSTTGWFVPVTAAADTGAVTATAPVTAK